jgi:adenylate cyclase
MKPRNEEDRPRAGLEKIELNLGTYNILLHFQDHEGPLVLHFDTPSRRFYFALIALVVTEMKNLGKPGFIYIRKHEKTLRLLDHSLAGPHASETESGMWEKIRTTWHYTLPDLKEAAHFKIMDRDRIPPYEKGGKYRYKCSDEESDTWANLFDYDEHNPWRFKFAVDSASLDLNNIQLTFDDKEGNIAWENFLEKVKSSVRESKDEKKIEDRIRHKHWHQIAAAVIVSLVVSAVGLSIWYFVFKPVPPAIEHKIETRRSIAVLPFVNISEDPDKEYFCNGITEELINSLARVKDLRVISRTSAFYFKDKGFDLRTIGEKLAVDNILEGSVRISEDQLRISAQLINVKTDSHLWTETYNREMKDIFDTQENIAKEIACNLKSRLGCKGDLLKCKYNAENVRAYDLFLRGRFFCWSRKTRADYEKAIHYYGRALEVDPEFAPAYAGLADVYSVRSTNLGIPPNESYQRAKTMALKALSIDDTVSEAHASLGIVQMRYDREWKGAEQSFKRAIDLNPASVVARCHFGWYLGAIGRLEDAINELENAIQIDPLNTELNWVLGEILRWDHKIDESIEQCNKVLEIDPINNFVSLNLGFAYVHKGLLKKGIEIMEYVRESGNLKENPFTMTYLGCAYAKAGQKEKTIDILKTMEARWREKYFSPYCIAMVFSCLDEKDKAFEWLNIALEIQDPIIFPIKSVPEFSRLHDDPRWDSLMKQMGLEE